MTRDGSIERLVGQVLASRYRICERLGAGAMGTVFRAEHAKIGRQLAVKVLHPRMLENEKFRRRFEREAEVAGRLHHPNIAGVIDVGITPEGLRYLVMEYADGRTLSSLLSEGPMTGARMRGLALQLCDGLNHAHEQGLVHRDFKPENVIVARNRDGEETLRILDFGIAIAAADLTPGERRRLTTEGMVLGTPHYMAPEQATGQAIDHRIDLFALGVMCFEMLTGVMPFTGTGIDVARAFLTRPIPPMKQRAPAVDVDPLLEAFTRALLQRAPDARLQSARIARELLELIGRNRTAAAEQLRVKLHAERRTLPIAPAPPPERTRGNSRPPEITPQFSPAAWTNLPTEKISSDLEAQTPAVPFAPTEPAQTLVSSETPTVRGPGVPPEIEPDTATFSSVDAIGSIKTPPIDHTAPTTLLPPVPSESVYVTRVAPTPPPVAKPITVPPPMQVAVAMATASVAYPTERAVPVRRWRPLWIAAALVAMGMFAMAALSLRGRSSHARPSGERAVAEATASIVPPEEAATAPAATVPAPSPTAPPTEHAPSEAISVPLPPAPIAPPPTAPRPAPSPSPRRRPPAPIPAAPPAAQVPPEVLPADPTAVAVADLYGAIGRSLKRLGETRGQDATIDLWPRFRRIRILEALRTLDGRVTTHGELRFLEQEIGRRSN